LELLAQASVVIACDGATESLHSRGIAPTAIVGDLDSLPPTLRLRYADRLHAEAEQESNDLTKAVRFAVAGGQNEALILGATGLREDHTLGNISLLLDYALRLPRVEMLTDYGLFTPILRTTTFPSRPGQQVSIFTPQQEVKIETDGLRWPIHRRALTSWWQGTLNETMGDTFTISLSGEGVGAVVYRLHAI
jgi:thiamine pyrophosphokinase